ncbi:hypothetical protein CTI12_AA169880 [Artemisia annua]|uniref:RRM domain-containing protein n=1 Tax=Artemisia annua TaxID=35608 RepID=A0A2U1PC42_ARTAN|nr:hypothetical protein CTI12_AA169880 [Artemisia annua]
MMKEAAAGMNSQNAKPEQSQVNPRPKHFVYVKNIARSVTEDYLKRVFSVCGDVKDVFLIRKRREPGYGFVYFKIREAAEVALRMDSTSVRGQCIVVKMGDPSMEESSGSSAGPIRRPKREGRHTPY